MKFFKVLIINFIILLISNTQSGCSSSSPGNQLEKSSGAYFTGSYRNYFSEVLNKKEPDINAKIDSIFNQLFYGNDAAQRIYYPGDSGMAYIEDVLHGDVRSEGMSYGMMIAVQLNKKNEFDRLWKWAKTYMQHKEGPLKNYFAWQLSPDGKIMDSSSAPDGEEWIVMSLFFAASRWGNGEGFFNYKAEAQKILDAMLFKESEPGNKGTVTNMFNKKEKMVVFVPEPQASNFTDPSYHLPHYYELWGFWTEKEKSFWREAADRSREFFKKAGHPGTGLFPDYARFDGTPYDPWGGGNNNFQYDAWRVAMNIAVDYEWFRENDWAVEESNRLVHFFHSQDSGKYGNRYTLDGKCLGTDHSTGLLAMNAAAASISADKNRKDFIEELWNTPIPDGLYRYYDSMLYFLGMLQVSGNFRIYKLQEN